jgi:NAD(P)-dependent dehydrogenase (short-subunit alcohol dehydrogenase family)
MKPLGGRVAVVVGATRGMGWAIAWKLGQAGATVYCAGSGCGTTRGRGYDAGRAATVEETAALVDGAGGVGIPIRLNPRVNVQVAALFARVGREQGRLDVLVNVSGMRSSGTPLGRFWTYTCSEAHGLHRAVWPHVVTCQHAAPLMVEHGSGLIVEVTLGDAPFDRPPLFSDLGRVAQIRLAAAVAKELAPHGVTALAVTPGCLPAETLDADVERLKTGWATWATSDPILGVSETPTFVGRVVVALAIDPRVGRKSGGLHSTWALGKEYGLTSEDGGGSLPEHHVSEPFRPVLLDDRRPRAAWPRAHQMTPATAMDGSVRINGLYDRTRRTSR